MTRRRKTAPDRKDFHRRWRIALANAEMSEVEWSEANGLTPSHVGQVARGQRESARASALMLTFIEQQERTLARRLAVA